MKVDTMVLTIYAIGLGVLFTASIGRSAVPENPFLGIPSQDENYYRTSSDTIQCKDGSNKFAKAKLNDDFCDCPDGTDEPGTSACPRGRFYCRNTGHTPVLLFSSRVNDGICDCCDGSDEYDGQVKCPNTCWEAGKVARDKLNKKIATYKEGVTLRKREVEQAKLAIAKDEAELSKLKDEESILKVLVQQLKEHKEQIEKAEEKERLQKEKEEKERKEAEVKANREKNEVENEAMPEKGLSEEKNDNEDKTIESMDDGKIGVLDDSHADQYMGEEHVDHIAEAEHSDNSKIEGSPIMVVEQNAEGKEKESVASKGKDDAPVGSETGHNAGSERNDAYENTEELSREELGRLVASRWTGNSEKQAEEVDVAKDDDHEEHDEPPQESTDEEYDGFASETDDDTGKYDDADIDDDADETYEEDIRDDASSTYKPDTDDELELSDTTPPIEPSWLEKIQQTVQNLLQAVNVFQTPVDKSEAAHVHKEYKESSAKLSKIQSRISSLTQKLKHDVGKEKEFYSFYGQCFESKQNKYIYKVCPFKHASQMEGHSTTRLGRWDKFEDSYQAMLFSNGDRCWNGPDRSMKVKLRCGLKNELTDIDEPSRCEYAAVLSAPVLCLEEKRKELEDQLDLMIQEKPQSHDEL